jgi:hypothetical protein
MLNRMDSPGEQLPINQFPAFTITLWEKVNGTTLTDLRLFAEGGTANNDPLFDLGTSSFGGAATLDLFFRQSGWTTVNHLQSVGTPLDNSWHHLAQKDGATGPRSTILTNYTSARGQGAADVGFATKDLDKLVVSGLTGHSTSTNLFFDDFYLSQSGFNSTVPRVFGFTTPVTNSVPAATMAIRISGSQVEISWTAGTLESSATVNSGWATVADATTSPYKVTPGGKQQFYRTKR